MMYLLAFSGGFVAGAVTLWLYQAWLIQKYSL